MGSTKRVALITGASGGIGTAVAEELAAAGVRVVLAYNTNEKAARQLLQTVRERGGDGVLLQADLRQPEASIALAVAARRQYGRLDILVNNAGHALEKLIIDTTAEEWDELMAVHVRSAFLCAKHVLPCMLRQRFGRIINVTSMWGQVGAANEVAYSTAKAALHGFTKALAKEVGPMGVTVNAVAPGVIRTRMIASYSEETVAELQELTPRDQLGTPHDVARTVRFLADDAAHFITGQIIGVNGGFVVPSG